MPDGAAVFPLIPAELGVNPLLLAVLHATVFLDGSDEDVVDPDAADEALEYMADVPAAPGRGRAAPRAEDMECLVGLRPAAEMAQAAGAIPQGHSWRLRRRRRGRGMTTDVSLDRYSRQMRFYGIGEDGQRRLLDSHVTLCGCGALGTVLANALVRAGVGHLRLIDRDFIETQQPAAAGALRRARRGREPAQGRGRRPQAGRHQLVASTSSRSSPTSTAPTSSSWCRTPT